jgi:hypothetical protein
MTFDYSPFNPFLWLIFAGFLVFVFLIVKLFHRRYPNYPASAEKRAVSEPEVNPAVEKEGNVSLEVAS